MARRRQQLTAAGTPPPEGLNRALLAFGAGFGNPAAQKHFEIMQPEVAGEDQRVGDFLLKQLPLMSPEDQQKLIPVLQDMNLQVPGGFTFGEQKPPTAKKSPFGLVDASKFTPESVAEFESTGLHSSLRLRGQPEDKDIEYNQLLIPGRGVVPVVRGSDRANSLINEGAIPLGTTQSLLAYERNDPNAAAKSVTFDPSSGTYFFPDGTIMNPETHFAAKSLVNVDDADKLTDKELNELRTLETSTMQMIQNANSLASMIESGPQATLGWVGGTGRFIESQFSQFGDFVREFMPKNEKDDLPISQLTDPGRFQQKLGIIATASARIQSQTMMLAYMLAKTDNEGGRISDSDIRNALDIIGGGGSRAQRLAKIDQLKKAKMKAYEIAHKRAFGEWPADNFWDDVEPRGQPEPKKTLWRRGEDGRPVRVE